MGDLVHILFTPSVARPWWPTHERFADAPKLVITDCCCCRMPAHDTLARIVTSWDPPLGGDLGCYQEPCFYEGQPREGIWAAAEPPTGAWFDGRIEVMCAPGEGCNKNPRRKFGMALRQMTLEPI